MKIGDVGIVDTFAIGAANFNLNDQGLVLIQGENLDDTSANSNGAGKSSLLNAIYWCLWGRTPPASNGLSLSGDAVIRKGAKRCAVLVELIDDDGSWHILRERMKGKEQVTIRYIDSAGVDTDHTQGTVKLNQVFIEKILGSSEDVFRAALFIGQEALIDLPSLTDKQLKEIVEEAAGVTALEGAYQIARGRMNVAVATLEKAILDLEHKRNGGTMLTMSISQANDRALQWKKDRIAELANLKVQMDEISAELDGIKKVIDDPIAQQQYKDAAAEIGVIKGKLSSHSTLMQDIEKLDTAHQKLNMEFVRVTAKLRTAVEAAGKMKQEVDRLATATPGTSECDECGSIMENDHLEHARKLAADRHANAIGEMRSLRGVWEAHKATLADSEATLVAKKAGITDVSALSDALNNLHEFVEHIDNHQKEFNYKKALLDNLSKSAALIDAKENPHIAEIQDIRAKIEENDQDITDLEVKEKVAALACEQITKVVEIFSPKGVRAQILDEVTPYLNDRTAQYLGALSDGNITATWNTLQTNTKGELKEKFSIDVAKVGSGESFAAVSGGEKRKVRLACALALQDLVATRATKPFLLWVGDEIDQALDPAGLERLMMVLQEKAKDRGTVLVISHSDLRDWIDNVWTMRLKDKKSELVL